MKLAIVVGHNARSQGAVRKKDGISEFVWNSDLAELIHDHSPSRSRIFFRSTGGGYSKEIDRVYEEVDAYGATASVELHFNGFADPRAEGCLTLSSGSSGSMRLARFIHPRMLRVMGNEDDGIRKLGRHDRGGRSLWAGRAPALMLEPYFAGNDRFCQIADHYKDELAEAIYRGACEFHKVNP